MAASDRAGRYVRQPTGYRAFVPQPLPPTPPLEMTSDVVGALSRAGLALGRLDGAARLLPNPDLFVDSFVRKEALLSSQIEGTQATLDDVLAPAPPPSRVGDVREVTNYVAATDLGVRRVSRLPVSLRLIREIHARLLRGVRGGDRMPGEFRRSQNWVGGASLAAASFVPPPPSEMLDALDRFERYMAAEPHAPELVKCGLLHAQFETIHPFLDGNGRVGRLLVTFLLQQWGILRRPILYLSLWFKQRRDEYYARLQAVRDRGEWEEWIDFFLSGIAETSDEAARTALAIVDLRERDLDRVRASVRSKRGPQLLESLFRRPLVDVAGVVAYLGVSQPTARTIVNEMERLGVLEEVTGRAWRRVFRYAAYMRLLRRGTDPPGRG